MAHPVVQRSNSRRRPYPYDMYIGETKVILEPGADGNLVAQKTKTLDATAPVDYTYSSANPFKERTFEWVGLYGGYGQYTEGNTQPRRYEHGEFVDTSINGLMFKGPKFESHVETITGAGEVRQFIQALHGGVESVFAICENGVWVRTADGAWAPSLTIGLGGTALPVGQNPQSALRFRSNDLTVPTAPVYGVNALYVACSAGNLWQYNGTTWTQAGTTAGPGLSTLTGEARWLERVGDEMWVAGDYWVVKTEVDGNPLDRANYAAPIWIGDLTTKITFLRQIDNALYIFKEDGIYTLSDTGLDQEILPTLRGSNNVRNGRNATVWLDKIWIPFGDQTFTLDAQGNLKPDGLEQVLENQSDVRGRWAAGASHNTWFMYEIYYNPLTDDSYLIKHGTWVEATESGSTVPGLAQFADAHHGALYTWNNKRASAADIMPGSIETIPGDNDRLYVGFTNGTIEWCVLPQTGPNPTLDGACEFTSNTSYIYLPIHHMGYQADNKLYRAISVGGPTLTNTAWVEIDYRFDTVNSFAVWATLDPDNPAFTLPRERKDFPNNTYAKLIQMRLKLVSVGVHETPVIYGIAVHQALRPSLALEWVFSVKLASHLAKHNGTTDRRLGSQLRAEVQEACADPGNVLVTLPTGEEEWMTLIDYRESAANWTKRRDHEWLAQITGIQLRLLSKAEPGYTGLTYATLETYTVGELESII